MDWSCYVGNHKWLPARTIFVTRHGSHAYGTNIQGSDLDLRGIAIPPAPYIFGFSRVFNEMVQHEPDFTVFGLHKFFKLAADCNPNVVEMLFTDPSDHLLCGVLGAKLIESRDLFLSQRARYTFSGYAVGQLKRIRTHRRWLIDPPKAPPERKAFGLSEETKFSDSEMGIFENKPPEGLTAEITELYMREKRWRNAKREWDQFQNWQETRNPTRAALEAKHGFDTKHGMHLVRLLRCGLEVLTGRGLIVRRPDADELLAVRRGEWSYEQIVEYAEKMEAEINAVDSPLPHHADRERLDRLCIEMTAVSCGVFPSDALGS